MNRPGTSLTSFNRANSLGYQVNYLARLLEHALRDRITPHGVVPGQFAQLLTLYEEDSLTQRELCDRVAIEQPTMAKTLQRMERDGLIVQSADPQDKRRSRITLTKRAKALRSKLITKASIINKAALRGLTDTEINTFMKTMNHIVRNLAL